jgi:hypothetical protein
VYFGTKKSAQVTIVDLETPLATTPSGAKVGQVDVMIRADDERLPHPRFQVRAKTPSSR